jgi:hypothetical protein
MSKEEAPTQAPAKSAAPKEIKVEAPTDLDGNTNQNLDRYPENSNARKGVTTLPSGQGGATPHDGVSYQDQWPPNYIPAEKKS